MAEYSVVVSSRADGMLILHAEFLARVSIPAARRLLQEFTTLISTLEDNPYLYQVDEDSNLPAGKYRRAIFMERYKALYTIEENIVYLEAVVDCRQDYKSKGKS